MSPIFEADIRVSRVSRVSGPALLGLFTLFTALEGQTLPPSTAPGDVVGSDGQVHTTNGATDPGAAAFGAAARAGACIGRNLLTQLQVDYCNNVARPVFQEVDTVKGQTKNGHTIAAGLGPTFNGNSCAGCHVSPAVGGSSPPPSQPNPQIAMGKADGATGQVIPFFIFDGGPIREARFINVPGTDKPDGGVHDVFTIKFRNDNGGCTATVPDFSAQSNNLSLRIPTPVFGDGLIEAIPESAINGGIKDGSAAVFGVVGKANRNTNDGTITRLGWKAQNKSMLLFSGEAYNVEIGVTNELFPNERDQTPDCQFQPIPEDLTNLLVDQTTPFDPFNPVPLVDASDIQNFTLFMRFLDQPTPACSLDPAVSAIPQCSAAVKDGANQFNRIGCALCHTPTLKTQISNVFTTNGDGVHPASGIAVNLYSDLLVHHMGAMLADGITQGLAGPDEFRSAPLWGVGQRNFFLHDGRALELITAIHFHAGEASQVVANFDALPQQEQNNVLLFLRSL